MTGLSGFKPEDGRGTLLAKNERLASELQVAEIQKKSIQSELDRANRTILVLEAEIQQGGVRRTPVAPPPDGWIVIARKADSAQPWSPAPDVDWTIKAARTAYDTGQIEMITRRSGRDAFELLIYRRRNKATRMPYFTPAPVI